MLLTELIRKFLFDCKIRELSELSVHNYEKQLHKFRHFVKEKFGIVKFEELKPIHVKEYSDNDSISLRKKLILTTSAGDTFRCHCVMEFF